MGQFSKEEGHSPVLLTDLSWSAAKQVKCTGVGDGGSVVGKVVRWGAVEWVFGNQI